jgi:hypothetical protein
MTNRPTSPTEVDFNAWQEFLDYSQAWLETPPADYPVNFGDLVDRCEAVYNGIGLVPPRDLPPAQPPPPNGIWQEIKAIIDWWRKWNNPVLPGSPVAPECVAPCIVPPVEPSPTVKVLELADGLAVTLNDFPGIRTITYTMKSFKIKISR